MAVPQRQSRLQTGTRLAPQAGFGEMYNAHHDRLLDHLTGLTRDRQMAEDVAAAAFATAYAKRETFRGESSFYTWLFAIARNESRQAWERRSRAAAISLDEVDALGMAASDNREESLERSEKRWRLREALSRLPAVYRQVLVDHFVQGHPVARLAAQYRIPLGTVLSRIFKAKRLLRAAWEV